MNHENIYQAMAAAMSDIEAIGKDQTNTHFKYKFRGIDDAMNAINPIFKKHEIFLIPELVEHTTKPFNGVNRSGDPKTTFYEKLVIKYRFCHSSGSELAATVPSVGLDDSDKGIYKALAGALKYALFQTFLIPTEEAKDPENDHIEVNSVDPSLIIARLKDEFSQFAKYEDWAAYCRDFIEPQNLKIPAVKGFVNQYAADKGWNNKKEATK